MKTTVVNLGPTKAAFEAGRPTLTPELLGATGVEESKG